MFWKQIPTKAGKVGSIFPLRETGFQIPLPLIFLRRGALGSLYLQFICNYYSKSNFGLKAKIFVFLLIIM
jgi:hypothetical protein